MLLRGSPLTRLPFAALLVALSGCTFVSAFPEPRAERCGNGSDDDLDGLLDCEDPGCDGSCPEGEQGPEATVARTCFDGRDQDGDGLVDIADPDCFRFDEFAVERCFATPGFDAALDPSGWLGPAQVEFDATDGEPVLAVRAQHPFVTAPVPDEPGTLLVADRVETVLAQRFAGGPLSTAIRARMFITGNGGGAGLVLRGVTTRRRRFRIGVDSIGGTTTAYLSVAPRAEPGFLSIPNWTTPRWIDVWLRVDGRSVSYSAEPDGLPGLSGSYEADPLPFDPEEPIELVWEVIPSSQVGGPDVSRLRDVVLTRDPYESCGHPSPQLVDPDLDVRNELPIPGLRPLVATARTRDDGMDEWCVVARSERRDAPATLVFFASTDDGRSFAVVGRLDEPNVYRVALVWDARRARYVGLLSGQPPAAMPGPSLRSFVGTRCGEAAISGEGLAPFAYLVDAAAGPVLRIDPRNGNLEAHFIVEGSGSTLVRRLMSPNGEPGSYRLLPDLPAVGGLRTSYAASTYVGDHEFGLRGDLNFDGTPARRGVDLVYRAGRTLREIEDFFLPNGITGAADETYVGDGILAFAPSCDANRSEVPWRGLLFYTSAAQNGISAQRISVVAPEGPTDPFAPGVTDHCGATP